MSFDSAIITVRSMELVIAKYYNCINLHFSISCVSLLYDALGSDITPLGATPRDILLGALFMIKL